MNWIASLNASNHRPKILLAASLAVIAAFLFTRLFALQDGLFFLNDMGRDFLVLLDWRLTWKPPLLGPQNSALPFNQSAMYFYWLMPVYVLSGFSYYASVYTLVLTYVFFFAAGMWAVRRHAWWPWLILGFSWLITLHPTSIAQNRFVWNPSFLAAFLLLTIVSYWYSRNKEKENKGPTLPEKVRKTIIPAILLGVGSGLSLAFSYSLIPVFVAFGISILIIDRWRSWKPLLAMAIGTFITHLPTLAFELRHNFFLTRAVGKWLGAGAVPDGTAHTFTTTEKLHDLFLHTLGVENRILQAFIVGFFFISSLYSIWKWRRPRTEMQKFFLFISSLLWFSIALTLWLPIGVHAHYIFGIATLFFLTVLTLPNWSRIILVTALSLSWLWPSTFVPHFARAPRTVTEMVNCSQQACQAVRQIPVFASLESGILPFHNGPDWRYMLASNGCNLQNLETTPQAADTMLVVSEFSEYVHNETSFNELSMFGPSREEQTITCSENLRVHILKKDE